MGALIVVGVLAVLALIIIIKTAVVVPQQSAYVIERLGKYNDTLQAGFHILVPFVDRIAYKHSLKEVAIDIPEQVCITRDNVRGLDEVLEHAASLGVRIHVQPLTADPRPAGDEPSAPDPIELSAALRRLLALKRSRSPMARWLGTSRAELLYYLQVSRGELRGCHCALVTATMLPDGGLIFCGSGRGGAVEDARSLGFAKAFSRLTLPECEGCTCAGKLRISRVFQLDPRAWIDQLLG